MLLLALPNGSIIDRNRPTLRKPGRPEGGYSGRYSKWADSIVISVMRTRMRSWSVGGA